MVLHLNFLHPEHASAKKHNNNSCVLKVTAGGHSLLLTGDIGKTAEREMVRQYGSALHADVLLVPHHGSASSSTPDFIEAVAPTYAIIPVGHLNRYRHPRDKVVKRYLNHGIQVLNTTRDGAISLKMGPEVGIKTPSCYRIDHNRFWHQLAKK